MFNGLGSLEAVACRIMRDGAKYNFRAATKYTTPQVIEKVVMQRKSVASSDPYVPSYLWCTVIPGEDYDGDVDFAVDFGKLPHWIKEDMRRGREQSWRVNWPKSIAEDGGNWQVVFGEYESTPSERVDHLIRLGLNIGQMFLVRAKGTSYFSYEGEYNEDWYPKIIYVRPAPVLWLPIDNPYYRDVLPGSVNMHEEAWQIGDDHARRFTLLSSSRPGVAPDRR